MCTFVNEAHILLVGWEGGDPLWLGESGATVPLAMGVDNLSQTGELGGARP